LRKVRPQLRLLRHPPEVTLNSQRLKAHGFLQPARWAVSPLWEQVSRPWAATAFVFVWVAFLWLLGEVPASDVVLFTVYEVTFVALPGWVVYGLLRPEASKGERLVFGWALGYALVIAFFAVTAAAGVRFLLFAYPLLVGAFGLWRVNTTGRVRPRPGYGRPLELDCGRHRGNGKRHGRGGTLPTEPAAGHRPSRHLLPRQRFSDLARGRGAPPLAPHRSDRQRAAAPYHTFAHMLMAATTQVTGIGLPTVVLRLLPLTMIALFAAQVAARRCPSGRARRRRATRCTTRVAQRRTRPRPAWRTGLRALPRDVFVGLWYSPTFLLGQRALLHGVRVHGRGAGLGSRYLLALAAFEATTRSK
jgi:hypothetical protein